LTSYCSVLQLSPVILWKVGSAMGGKRSAPPGLDRRQAAQWASRVTGYEVGDTTVRYWEERGLLRRQRPGNRRPASYGLPDLIQLRLLVELRREGAPLQRIRRALEELGRLFPELKDRPGSWTLAVTASGSIALVTGAEELVELSRRPGQSGWFYLIDGAGYMGEAKQALAANA